MTFSRHLYAHFPSQFRRRMSIFAFSFYFSEMCLEQALTIYALLQKQQCPDGLTTSYLGWQKGNHTLLLLEHMILCNRILMLILVSGFFITFYLSSFVSRDSNVKSYLDLPYSRQVQHLTSK